MLEERWKSNTIGGDIKGVDATPICALYIETRKIKDCT